MSTVAQLREQLKTKENEIAALKTAAKNNCTPAQFKTILDEALQKLQAENDKRFSALETELAMQKQAVKHFGQELREIEDDIQERAVRRANLVVHGLPNSVDAGQLKQAIMQHCEKAIGPDFELTSIIEVVRLGRRASQASSSNAVLRPMPVLVKFASIRARDTVLRCKRMFSGEGSTLKLYWDPDLTPRQQTKKRSLVGTYKQLKQLNARPFWRSEQLFFFNNGKAEPEMHPANFDPAAHLEPVASPAHSRG
jgi:hypothetical protein